MEFNIDAESLLAQLVNPGCCPSGLPPECYVGTMHSQIASVLCLVCVRKLGPEDSTLLTTIQQLRTGEEKNSLAFAAEYIRAAVEALIGADLNNVKRRSLYQLLDSIKSPIVRDKPPTLITEIT